MTTQAGRCRRCGAAVVDGERFCGECGQPVPTTPPPAPTSVPSSPPPAGNESVKPTSRHGPLFGALLALLVLAGGYFAGTQVLGPRLAARNSSPPVAETDSMAAQPDDRANDTAVATAGPSQPLVSDEAVNWAAANGFDRYQAQQQLAEGQRHLRGDGLPVDYERARQLLESAAQYEGRAAFHLFEIYGNGLGVLPDVNASFQWLRRGAELGDAEAQYVLARFYFDGFTNFLAPDPALGERWMRTSASQGYEPARAFLIDQGRIR